MKRRGKEKGNRNKDKETPTTDIQKLREEIESTQQDDETNTTSHYDYRQSVAWVYLTYTGDWKETPQYAGVMETDDGCVIYIVRDTHNRHSYMPKRNGWYPCVIPEPEQDPLFIACGNISFIPKGEMVYISKVLPAETKTTTVNGNSAVIIRSPILMQDDLLKENLITLFFGKTNFCRIWIESPKKRGEILWQLLGKDGGPKSNSWTNRSGMLVPSGNSSLSENDIINVVLGNKT